jgi:colicin import membrane protein
VKQADIATAQAKKKAEAEKRELAEKAAAKRKAEALEKEKEAKQKAAEKLAQDRKAEEQKKKLAEQKKQEQERQAAERRRDEQLTAKLRADQMARMMGQVGASGSPDARGSAAQSSAPSSGYGNRVRERIRPNIRYSEELPRNLLTEIEVRTLADGTISSRRVVKSSGNAAWDDAALRAIDRTGSLPRDTDGRVPSPMIVEMRPLD